MPRWTALRAQVAYRLSDARDIGVEAEWLLTERISAGTLATIPSGASLRRRKPARAYLLPHRPGRHAKVPVQSDTISC